MQSWLVSRMHSLSTSRPVPDDMARDGGTIRIEVVDAARFAEMLPAAAVIYGEAMQRAPQFVAQRLEIMQAHVSRQGLVACIAVDGAGESDEMVGFGYGYLGRPGEWWHDVVGRALADDLGADAAAKWLTDTFELAELHVLPEQQGRGAGRRLLSTVLAESGGTTVVLSTHDRESPARHLYRSVGFVDLLRGFVFPGSTEVHAVLGLER